MNYARIEAAYERVHLAERARNAAIRATCKVGTTVTYKRGEHIIAAEVVDYDYDDRLLVRGASGKTYWVGAHLLIA